ncbi:acid protease [Dothidotthia symphoricarpi CBS 119687]|uniref:Probable aspartic-type endopeptidase OPSB n=1 Tax=Dothidotthia symphoricarpi CBS 119687 TaxID=1392245 RepID=A0A6A6ABG2_9PLEO|nr:acid protease [Dothidotthia symphoricarpi CBS 119687]KAF2128916.1 acid protease [Dothidotthia symphoricarpi CBS 119687]
MKYSTFFAAHLVSSAVAIRLSPRENPRVIGLDIQRKSNVDPIAHDRMRKRAPVQQTLDNLDTLYFANASLGTPQQSLRLHIDTGSSDLWVNTPTSTLCSQRGDQCSDSGTYNANDSSTYSYVNGEFNISYVDGSGASGDYVTDTFHFGGQAIKDFQFGVGYTSSSSEAVLGIGYAINEVAVNRGGLDPYPNLPQKLANDSTINSVAYSLWLNDLDASTGNILFGGVDTDKYHGSLHTLPIIQEQGVYAEFLVNLNSLSMNNASHNLSLISNQNLPVLLDSGTSLTYLPSSIVSTLYTKYSAQYDSSQGTAFVDCDVANLNDHLVFTFAGANITVPMNELVVVGAVSRGQPVCILGIAPSGNSVAILGDTFLRSAYVVYDLDNNQISLAQTNFNATTSNIQEIQAGTSGVPNASGVADTASTSAGATAATSRGAAAAAMTANPWIGGAALAGAGLLMGFNGL